MKEREKMRKLLICTALLMLISTTTAMADAAVEPIFSSKQSGHLWVNMQKLVNGVETPIAPGNVMIMGGLAKPVHGSKIIELTSCHTRIKLEDEVLYQISLEEIKNDNINCRMKIRKIYPDSSKSKQLKSQPRSGK